jgi:methylenetetrahydrofolate dehydrogenase (NADP+)/methenyltetrahydrofolate cyclohydrolase
MAARIIDGEKIAAQIKEGLKKDIEELAGQGKCPHIAAVMVGENPGVRVYVRSQERACQELGIKYTLDQHPDTMSEEELASCIQELNADPEITGIILLMPVPAGINARRIQAQIAPGKDVEGMNPENLGRLIYGTPLLGPCTAVGAVELLKTTGVPIEGAEALVVGHSEIVGKPIAVLLLGLNATTHICHIFTKDLAYHTKNTDILFVAAGKSGAVWQRYWREKRKYNENPEGEPPPLPDLSPLIKADMLKPGVVIIDVAINRIPEALDENGDPVLNEKGRPQMKTTGDVDFEAAKEIASWITPVPGGVGPMTVAMLLKNAVEAARQ